MKRPKSKGKQQVTGTGCSPHLKLLALSSPDYSTFDLQQAQAARKINGISIAKFEAKQMQKKTALPSHKSVQQLYAEVNTLKLQNQGLKKCVERKETEQQLENERYTRDFDGFRTQKEELQKTCVALRSKTQKAQTLAQEARELKAQVASTKERLDALRGKNMKLEGDQAFWQASVASLRQEKEMTGL